MFSHSVHVCFLPVCLFLFVCFLFSHFDLCLVCWRLFRVRHPSSGCRFPSGTSRPHLGGLGGLARRCMQGSHCSLYDLPPILSPPPTLPLAEELLSHLLSLPGACGESPWLLSSPLTVSRKQASSGWLNQLTLTTCLPAFKILLKYLIYCDFLSLCPYSLLLFCSLLVSL